MKYCNVRRCLQVIFYSSNKKIWFSLLPSPWWCVSLFIIWGKVGNCCACSAGIWVISVTQPGLCLGLLKSPFISLSQGFKIQWSLNICEFYYSRILFFAGSNANIYIYIYHKIWIFACYPADQFLLWASRHQCFLAPLIHASLCAHRISCSVNDFFSALFCACSCVTSP